MNIHDQAPVLDAILESWRSVLGDDFTAYRNHCYRVLNFALAFCEENPQNLSKLAIAVAFHDLGIWTNHTCDYLDPSKQLARDYLVKNGQKEWCDEIEAMIGQHHKIRRYKAKPNWLVEPFRKADWTDVSKGIIRFGLESSRVADLLAHFPNAGFHNRLLDLSKQRLKTHPFNPLPMLRF